MPSSRAIASVVNARAGSPASRIKARSPKSVKEVRCIAASRISDGGADYAMKIGIYPIKDAS